MRAKVYYSTDDGPAHYAEDAWHEKSLLTLGKFKVGWLGTSSLNDFGDEVDARLGSMTRE